MTFSALDAQLSSALFEVGSSLPEALVVFVASYLIWVQAALALIMLWRCRAVSRGLISLVAGAALAYGANAVIGALFFRLRPFVLLGLSPLITTVHLGSSFPSDHAAVAFALAAGYAFLDKKNARLFWALALAVSLGRVLAGVHFAGDVVAGAAVGFLASHLAHRVRLRFTP